MYFYGLFSNKIDEDFFVDGKLYRIKKQIPNIGSSIDTGGVANSNMFWKVRYDGQFLKSSVVIKADVPLLYVGIHEDVSSKFHLFLYDGMKVFTLGLLNAAPSHYWEAAVSCEEKEETETQ